MLVALVPLQCFVMFFFYSSAEVRQKWKESVTWNILKRKIICLNARIWLWNLIGKCIYSMFRLDISDSLTKLIDRFSRSVRNTGMCGRGVRGKIVSCWMWQSSITSFIVAEAPETLWVSGRRLAFIFVNIWQCGYFENKYNPFLYPPNLPVSSSLFVYISFFKISEP